MAIRIEERYQMLRERGREHHDWRMRLLNNLLPAPVKAIEWKAPAIKGPKAKGKA